MQIAQAFANWLRLTQVVDDQGPLDAIEIHCRNVGPGAGGLTVTYCGRAWTAHWSAMGSQTVEQFCAESDSHYLLRKLDNDLPHEQEVADPDWFAIMRRVLIERRRAGQIDRPYARRKWDLLVQEESIGRLSPDTQPEDRRLLRQVLGTYDWWEYRPKEENPAYLSLLRVVQAVQRALQRYLQTEEKGEG